MHDAWLEKDLGDEIAWKHDNETDDCGGTKWKITTLEDHDGEEWHKEERRC